MAKQIKSIETKFPNNINLLALYKIEKEQMDFPSDPFPSFQDWRASYKVEWLETHSTSKLVDAETAVKLSEEEMENDQKQQQAKPEKKVTVRKIKSTPKVKVKKEKVPTKAERALKVYQEMMVNGNHPARKEVVQRFMNELNMSVAGASTYQYNIKKKLS